MYINRKKYERKKCSHNKNVHIIHIIKNIKNVFLIFIQLFCHLLLESEFVVL